MYLSKIKVRLLGSERFSNRKKIVYSIALALIIIIGVYVFHLMDNMEETGKVEPNSVFRKALGWIFFILDISVGFLCIQQWLLPFRDR